MGLPFYVEAGKTVFTLQKGFQKIYEAKNPELSEELARNPLLEGITVR